ncbi:hypothetical protein [Streptomyces sp. CB01881]|uniref:hypothetical protein n=1 Tax=Streptomyces sp. CB01881 TaxID=2078691 RepID=UPI000CDC6E80|nr:hypothetical protein [Streptomyces sp. CB01881]AUY49273.1 hypothetical protein C2142_10360 [Streptomyces sp. CB01881]TYC72662.1 hypothetical protein EH183_10360 [Streptomyces sp. CB01881]
MLPKTVRGAVEVAAGLVEEVGKRVVGTAAGLLEKSGVDVAEVERRLGGQFPPSAKSLQTLAEEAVTAGRAGVDLAVGVARGEVEKAFERVGDQVTKVGVVLAYLESKLREVEEDGDRPAAGPQAGAGEPGPAPRADGLFGQGWEREDEPVASAPVVAERVEVDAPVEVDPPVPPTRAERVREAAAQERPEKAPAKGTAAVKPEAGRTTSRKTADGKAAAGTAATNGAVTKKAVSKKTTAGKTTAGKTTAGKAATKKTTAKKTTAKKAAVPEASAGRSATKKTTARKTGGAKKPEQPGA